MFSWVCCNLGRERQNRVLHHKIQNDGRIMSYEYVVGRKRLWIEVMWIGGCFDIINHAGHFIAGILNFTIHPNRRGNVAAHNDQQ